MFRNKLMALEHPCPDSVNSNCSDPREFASIILWLEDQKIRHYKIEDRQQLRDIENIAVWDQAYEQFKADIGVPKLESRSEELAWILSYAVRLEYLDQADNYQPITAAAVSELRKPLNPLVNSKNPFDSMDMSSKEFENGVRELGRRLNIAYHPDHLKVLDAAARVIERNFGNVPTKHSKEKVLAYSVKDEVKFKFSDKDLDEAAKILRLLQLHNLRQMQTAINEAIVSIQDLTANPKTDTKLGKVGF